MIAHWRNMHYLSKWTLFLAIVILLSLLHSQKKPFLKIKQFKENFYEKLSTIIKAVRKVASQLSGSVIQENWLIKYLWIALIYLLDCENGYACLSFWCTYKGWWVIGFCFVLEYYTFQCIVPLYRLFTFSTIFRKILVHEKLPHWPLKQK